MKSKILVADDGDDIRIIVSEALEKSDAIIESIGNGEAAFNFLDEFNADLVLVKSDILGISGPQLCEKIKRSQKYFDAKVILLISESDDFTDKQYVESMADDLVFKPFKPTEIYKKIKKALGNRLQEAFENVEMDGEEDGGDTEDEEPKPSSTDGPGDEFVADDNGLGLNPAQKAKEVEQAFQSSPQNVDGDDDFARNEYAEDDYQDESGEGPALTEAMIDMALIANPLQIPYEHMELSYFLASGAVSPDEDVVSKDTGRAEDNDTGKSAPEIKRDAFFDTFIESISAAGEVRFVFERMLYLDSYMREREIADLTDSVTNSIQDAIYGITRNTVHNIISGEIKK